MNFEDLEEMMQASNYETKTDLVYVRTFKTYLYALQQFSLEQIDNIISYMDKYDSGIIYIVDIACALENDYDPYVESPDQTAPIPKQ